VFDRIFPGDQGNIDTRTATIQDDAKAAGDSLSYTEARLQAVTQRIDELNEALVRGEGEWVSFATAFLGPFRDIFGGEAAFPGTTAALREEVAVLGVEDAFLSIQRIQEQIETIAHRAQRGAKDISDDLDPIRSRLEELRDGLSEFNAEDLTIGGEQVTFGQFQTRLAEQKRLIAQTKRALDGVADVLAGYTEALTPEQVTEALRTLQTRLQLGDINTEQALEQVQYLRDQILEYRKQAQHADERDEIEKATEAYLETRQFELQVFQQDLQDRLDLVSIIPDSRARLEAELRSYKEALDSALANIFIGPQIAEGIRRDIRKKELELIEYIQDQKRQRLQLAVDFAKTFEEQIAALQDLKDAIIAEANARGGPPNTRRDPTAEEQAELNQITQRQAEIALQRAQLIARNQVLLASSSLDETAAIRATIAALRVQIAWMHDYDEDQRKIVAKEIELRDAITQLRLAEADRRAAFFRLTAGVGDEVAAAQADLRAAIDRYETIVDAGGEETQQGYEAELEVLQARYRLTQLALRYADLSRRASSDLTDSYEQALLDVQAAQEASRRATGDLEKIQAEIDLAEAESRAQREFYDRRLADLDFLYQTDQIGQSQYIAALRALQGGIDRTTRQGEELWREIELQIRGLQEDASQAFNIPTEIRLPTLFEVRRALAADALGVNYQDNRQQEINVFVSDDVDVNSVIDAINSAFGGSIDLEAQRLSSGGAGITIGGFN
jgi:hypothetical protein